MEAAAGAAKAYSWANFMHRAASIIINMIQQWRRVCERVEAILVWSGEDPLRGVKRAENFRRGKVEVFQAKEKDKSAEALRQY